MRSVSHPADVVVLGEVLVELSSLGPLTGGVSIRLGFSGDALNVAAAAAAAGARTVLLTRVPDDELGDALVARIGQLGIDTAGVLRTGGQHGVYFTHADPDGERQFVYVRTASAGSALCVDDLDEQLLSSAGVVVASGVTAAISPTAEAAVRRAAELARRLVYDPNYRPRLTTAAEAGDLLRAVAQHAEVITPSGRARPARFSDLAQMSPPTRRSRPRRHSARRARCSPVAARVRSSLPMGPAIAFRRRPLPGSSTRPAPATASRAPWRPASRSGTVSSTPSGWPWLRPPSPCKGRAAPATSPLSRRRAG